MSTNETTLVKVETPVISENQKSQETDGMDGLIKFVIAVLIAVVAFKIESGMSLALLTSYLIFATVVTRVKFKTLLLSAASFFIIVLIPYLFGYLMSEFLFWATSNELFAYSREGFDVFLRLFRLFVIWYVSILYFHTTPMETVLGLLEKLLYPFILMGAPIKDYLNIIMCIVLDLKGKGMEVKDGFMANARSIIGGDKVKLKGKIKGISQIIVSLLISSFEKINDVQEMIESMEKEDLYDYKFKLSFKDLLAMSSFVLVGTLLYMIETGYFH